MPRSPLVRDASASLGDFERYTDAAHYDLEADGVRFRKVPLRLNAAAYAAFLEELDALVARYERSPTPGGRLRLFTHTSLPFAHNLEDKHGDS